CHVRVFFFFQAEDGIRDRNVTGVQTCALPISFFYTPASFLRPRHDVRHAREDSAIAAWADVVFLSPSCSHAAQNIRTPKIPRWSFDGLCAKECCAVTRQRTWFYKALFAPLSTVPSLRPP